MMARSLLFVPAKEKLLRKIANFNADGYILDLEDSIEESDKPSALKRVCEFVNGRPCQNIWVRINSDRACEELNALKDTGTGFMLSKIESAAQYEKYLDVLLSHPVIALIETPKAVVHIQEIAECEYVDALALGAEDFSAKMNMVNCNKNLIYARSRLVVNAKAVDKSVYDTPSFQLNDWNAFKNEVEEACGMGFDGKLCINPKQIEYINSCFGKYDLDFMRKVVSMYAESGNEVVVIDGVVYEKMHIDRMIRILKEHEEG